MEFIELEHNTRNLFLSKKYFIALLFLCLCQLFKRNHMKQLTIGLFMFSFLGLNAQSKSVVFNECPEGIGIDKSEILVFVTFSPSYVEEINLDKKDAEAYNKAVKDYAPLYKGKYEIISTDELDKISSEGNYKYLFNVTSFTYPEGNYSGGFRPELEIRGCGTMVIATQISYSFKYIMGKNIGNTVKGEINGIEKCRSANASK